MLKSGCFKPQGRLCCWPFSLSHCWHRTTAWHPFIILSAPPLASQVKSPYPSQYMATLLEKTTLACWFARQVQMLRWGKLAWFSGLLSRWNSKTSTSSTRLERLSIVYTESLCGDGVDPAIKILLEQAGIWINRPRSVPGGRKNLSSSLPTLLLLWSVAHIHCMPLDRWESQSTSSGADLQLRWRAGWDVTVCRAPLCSMHPRHTMSGFSFCSESC